MDDSGGGEQLVLEVWDKDFFADGLFMVS